MPALNLAPQDVSALSPASTQRIHLIADDLTGACDAAAAFLPGDSVRVWLGDTEAPGATETVQAFNTDSRDLAPDLAARVVAACALRCSPDALLFKKIDSAGRGPIAAELLAAQDALQADLILLAASFPAHGRIVKDGVLNVFPATGPAVRLALPTLFGPQHQPFIAILDHAPELLPAVILGHRIAICNAETQEELEAFAKAAAALHQRILYAGSAGLAHALAAARQAHHTLPLPSCPTVAKALLIVGTLHPVTQLQLAHLGEHMPDTGLLTIRCAAGDDQQVRSRFLQDDPDALILTGGDTALLALRALGARSIQLRGAVEPGVPWGVIDGGLAHGRVVVTKSGGFGSAPTLQHILTTLSGKE